MKGSRIAGQTVLAIAWLGVWTMGTPPLRAQTPWPARDGAHVASSSEAVPPFPDRWPGFVSEAGRDFWGNPFSSRGTIRIFQDQGWQGLPDFPNTQNGCASGAFMIRWRSANPEVRIKSSARNSAELTFNDRVATGMFGYMSGNNCEQPMFDFGGVLGDNPSTLVDLHYELKFWRAAP